MDLSTGISVFSALTALVALIYSRRDIGHFKSNCIATLQSEMKSVQEQMKELKPDAIIEWKKGIEDRLSNGSEQFSRINDRLEKIYEEAHDAKINSAAFVERIGRLYMRMDNFEMDVKKG